MPVILLALALGCFALGALLTLLSESLGDVSPAFLLLLGLALYVGSALAGRRTPT
jgi:hypothetical protein